MKLVSARSTVATGSSVSAGGAPRTSPPSYPRRGELFRLWGLSPTAGLGIDRALGGGVQINRRRAPFRPAHAQPQRE